jgi:hypothetical protein
MCPGYLPGESHQNHQQRFPHIDPGHGLPSCGVWLRAQAAPCFLSQGHQPPSVGSCFLNQEKAASRCCGRKSGHSASITKMSA